MGQFVDQSHSLHAGRLRSNALSLTGSLVIGMATAAPTVGIALVLASLVAANSFAAPLEVLICGIPLLGIAWSYRRLNATDPNCGATYTWGAKAVSPYFGFMSGWISLLAYFIGAVAVAVPIGPYALQLFGGEAAQSDVGQALTGSLGVLLVGVIAYVGIRATAKVQWILIGIEYTGILILFVLALRSVFSGAAQSVPFEWSWFSWDTLGGTSGFAAGALVGIFFYTGWEASILVNEETKDPRRTPGNAAVLAVLALAIILPVFTFGFQGAVKPEALQAHGDNILYYIAQQLSGSVLAHWMILAVLLSAIGSTLGAVTGGARLGFAMGFDQVLPRVLGRTHPRYNTPTIAIVIIVVAAIAALWLYSLGSSTVQGSFDTTISTDGLLFLIFYSLTGIATMAYYRRLDTKSLRGFCEFVGIPLAATAFLVWVAVRSVTTNLGGWGGKNMVYLYVMLGIGVVLMLYSRFSARSSYFGTKRSASDLIDEAQAATEPQPVGEASDSQRPVGRG